MKKACGRCHVSRSTLWRRVRLYDRTEESLLPRSRRIDHERSCRTLSSCSLEDLGRQGAAWLRRHDPAPRCALGLRSPDEDEIAKLRELCENEAEARRLRLLRRSTSSVS